MKPGNGRAAAEARALAALEQAEWLQPSPQANAFERAIRALIPVRSTSRIVELFGAQCAASTIRGWRYGCYQAPPWARDILHERLIARGAEFYALAEEIKNKK